MTDSAYIGFDIGGGSAKVALLSADGKILDRARVDHKGNLAGDTLTAAYLESAEALLDRNCVSSCCGLGLGFPGHIDEQNLVTLHSNVPALNGYPLAERLAEALNCPVRIANDANLAALAEYKLGNGAGPDRVLMITVGTGIGAAFISNGEIINTANGTLGDAGHLIVDYKSNRQCRLGCTGCAESIASGDALARRALEIGLSKSEHANSILSDLFNEAETPHSRANQIVAEATLALACVTASLIHVFAPQRIVLGGGVIDAAPELFSQIAEHTRNISMGDRAENIEFTNALLGNDAGVIGAGLLAAQG